MHTPPPDYVAPPWLVFVRRYIWVISFVLAAISLTLIRPLTRRIAEPPPVLFSLPTDYELTDHSGQPFNASTMRGEVWVASFVFTRCPSTCPAVTRAMQSLRARFDRQDVNVKQVSFTVDPDYDTVPRLAAYAETVGATRDMWRFVTGDLKTINTLVAQGFKLALGERGPGEDGLFDIEHSIKLVLVDPQGNVRGFFGLDPTLAVDGGLDELYERADRVRMEFPQTESKE